MKKCLLLSLSVAAAVSASAFDFAPTSLSGDKLVIGRQASVAKPQALTRSGEQSYLFSYDEGLGSAVRFQGPTGGVSRVYLAFQMSPDDVKLFAGAKVTGFGVYSATNQDMTSNSIKEGQFFCSTDLVSATYSQDFKLSTQAFAFNDIALDEAYTITGEEEALFFGYSLLVPKANNMYYTPVDAIPNDVPTTGIFGYSDVEGQFPTEYGSFTDKYGALCMSLRIEGENLPQSASFYTYPTSYLLEKGKASSIPVFMKALSTEPIKSVDYDVTFNGQTYSDQYTLPEEGISGDSYVFDASVSVQAVDELTEGPLTVTLTKLNGREIEMGNHVAEISVKVVDYLPAHQTLIEEYTGTWCGWCTGGYAMLEYIKKNEPDFVVAAYHNQDPMQVTTNYPSQVSGFPCVYLDRYYQADPVSGMGLFGGKAALVKDVNYLNSMPSSWGLEVSHEWKDIDKLDVTAEFMNVLGNPGIGYKVAYILVADGLSGGRDWMQSNYYYSRNPSENYVEELKAFCRGGEYAKSSVAGLVFNDVVVTTTGIRGVSGSIPSELGAYEKRSHTISFDLSKISSDLIPDRNKLRVIAAIVDGDGYVYNCAKNEVDDYDSFVTAVEGIYISDNAPVEFYNLNGMKVAEPTEGIFIRRQGSKSEKVIIR